MSSPRDAVVDVCVCEASADGFVDVEVIYVPSSPHTLARIGTRAAHVDA